MSKVVDLSINHITRESILEILREVGEPLNERVLELSLKKSGIVPTKNSFKEALTYLKQKGLIMLKDVSNKKLGIYMQLYSITAKGIDYLEGTIEVEGLGDE